MSDFSKLSINILESEVKKSIKSISKNKKIGIFGTLDSAKSIYFTLIKEGFRNIIFIKSKPIENKLYFREIKNFEYENICDLECIFTSSLAKSENQKKALLEIGYNGKIVCLPNLKHLSTSFGREHRSSKQVKKFITSEKNHMAFIVGNGPSLNNTDPTKIEGNFDTFACNGIVNKENFIPNFYFSLDHSSIINWKNKISNLESLLFFPLHLRPFIKREIPRCLSKSTFFPLCYEHLGRINLENWQTKGFEAGHTVVSTMIQFAILAKYSKIFLIGIDLSYNATNKNYFVEGYHWHKKPEYNKFQNDQFNDYMHYSIERATHYGKEKGIEIYNCSPTNNLPFLEYIPFEKVLKIY